MKKILAIIIFVLFLAACSITQFVEQAGEPIDEPMDEQLDEQSDLPLENPAERITKKPFGIKISPSDSPVQPEKFSGYHTGVDFEIFEGEEDVDISVYAICDGPLLTKRYVNGYGGVAIQQCVFNDSDATVLYGHLKLEGIEPSVGQMINKSEKIGILGAGYSDETDDERKHLHLGVHKGSKINYLGYVQDQLELGDWMNPLMLIPDLAWASAEDRTKN